MGAKIVYKNYALIDKSMTSPQSDDISEFACLEDLKYSNTPAKLATFEEQYMYGEMCIRDSTETAGRELEAHIVNGGDFTEIIGEISKAVQESGFFQALSTKQAAHSKEREKAEK